MRKVLIAIRSEELCASVADLLGGKYRVYTCSDGKAVPELLRKLTPDGLIIDFSLPNSDGITALKDAGEHVPSVVLALTLFASDYVLRISKELGVGFILMLPCSASAVAFNITEMLRLAQLPTPDNHEPQTITAFHLQKLGLPVNLDGYQQLRVGIPLFSQDTSQKLTKELYPSILSLCGGGDWRKAERSIRDAIKIAWEKRDESVWSIYFPPGTDGTIPCPRNKEFIARLADILKNELIL